MGGNYAFNASGWQESGDDLVMLVTVVTKRTANTKIQKTVFGLLESFPALEDEIVVLLKSGGVCAQETESVDGPRYVLFRQFLI